MRSVSHELRRLGAVLLLCCPAAACTFMGGDVRSIYEFGKQVLVPQGVTLAEAASSPYASLGLRVGNSPEIMIILATDSGGEQLWTSAAHIAIVTSAGRVIRTSGLGHDLGNLVSRDHKSGSNRSSIAHWLVDIPELKAYAVPVVCESFPTGDETIVVLGKALLTRRVVERCRAEASTFNWTFKNVYWIDPDSGLVWRSVQHINPKLDALELEVLRPPA